MASQPLSTSAETFIKLIGNGTTYKVPTFQRDYSWDKTEWEDLWFDLMDLPTEKKHYMGYVVIQPIDDKGKAFWIIDGQQRFTTLSVLCLSAIRLLKEWSSSGIDKDNNNKRAELLTERFLGNYSSSKLTITSKLFLNRNNDDFYQSYLLSHRKPAVIGKLKPSEKKLWHAYDFFYNKIKEHFKNPEGDTLASFIEDEIASNLIFTTISVSDDLNAYKVFETLNARGVKLSPADLIKNMLFSIASNSGQQDFLEAERRWQNINDILNKSDLPTFIRYYWNTKNSLVRTPQLFREIKSKIKTAEQVFGFLKSLEDSAPLFVALENSGDSLWTVVQRPYIKAINLLGISQVYPVLMAAYTKFAEQEFNSLLHEIEVISFRFSISSLNTNEIERVVNDACLKIESGEIITASGIFSIIKGIYVDDDAFKQSFSTKELSTKRHRNFIKYILIKIENTISGSTLSAEESAATIEHILPENPGSYWDEYFDPTTQDEYIYLIGNYTLLEVAKNNKLHNNISYSEKLAIYKTSQYKICNSLLNYDNWTPDVLRQYQDKLATYAKTTWKSKYIQNV